MRGRGWLERQEFTTEGDNKIFFKVIETKKCFLGVIFSIPGKHEQSVWKKTFLGKKESREIGNFESEKAPLQVFHS